MLGDQEDQGNDRKTEILGSAASMRAYESVVKMSASRLQGGRKIELLKPVSHFIWCAGEMARCCTYLLATLTATLVYLKSQAEVENDAFGRSAVQIARSQEADRS